MKSIIATYPYFGSLPKGIKKMLLASESFFFDEAKSVPPVPRRASRRPVLRLPAPRESRSLLDKLHPAWRN